MPSTKVMHPIPVRQLSHFQANISPVSPGLQINRPIIFFS